MSRLRSRQHFAACPMLSYAFRLFLQLWRNLLGNDQISAPSCTLERVSRDLPVTLMIGPNAGSSIKSPDCTNSYNAVSQLAVLGLPRFSSHAYFTLIGTGVGGSMGYCHHLGWSRSTKEFWLVSSPLMILARLFCIVMVLDLRN